MSRKSIAIYLSGIGVLLLSVASWYAVAFISQPEQEDFNGQRAYEDVQTQVSFGPRTPGSSGHERTITWIQSELSEAGWNSRIQSLQYLGHPIQNVIAYRNNEPPQIILAAHYDTRLFADNDPDPSKRTQPVPGANDGASGVAVLIELARILPENTVPLWLVFFDAEDNGRIQNWDWILGSRAFVDQLTNPPEAAVIVDMVGDSDLNVYIEKTSDPELVNEIWTVAAELGYGEAFIPEPKYAILDDHKPFLDAGIPAVDIIDFDYPSWHTTEDTIDKISSESLDIVGETLFEWVSRRSDLP